MGKKLAIIISSVAIAVATVVGIVFAVVFGNNVGVPDNEITVTDPYEVKITGNAMTGAIAPGESVESQTFTISLVNVPQGDTYNLVFNNVDTVKVKDPSLWWIAVKRGSSEYTTEQVYGDIAGGILLTNVQHNETFKIKVFFKGADQTATDAITTDMAGASFKFDLVLEKAN